VAAGRLLLISIIRRAVDVELARQQWEEGRRRVELTRDDGPRFRRLSEQVELIAGDLRRRVGLTYTLAELADAYDGAVEWARETLHDAQPEGAPPPETTTVVDAAFHAYSRDASDYAP